ncbi:MAG: hypothetical protein ACI8P0_000680 [Planctomycetaceae bacterium]|jgi:hypothetical protein
MTNQATNVTMNQPRNYRWLLVVQLYLATAIWGAVQVGGDDRRLQVVFSGFSSVGDRDVGRT